MSAITASAVTIRQSYEAGDRYGGFVEKVKIVDIVLSAQGGTADDIPASVLGLTTINWATCVRAIDGSSVLSTVNIMVEADGAGILIADPEGATDATRGNAANYTGTVRVRLGGV